MNYSLYPPVIDAQMPAFIAYDGTNVSFTLSAYNSPSDIGGVQVTVREMAGNTSVLNDYKYPAEIMDIPYASLIQTLDQRTGETIYSFKLDYTSIPHTQSGEVSSVHAVNFVPGVYYKVQLRFFNHSYNRSSGQDQPTDSDISNNLDNLSEWSTVCLLKGISKPTVFIDQFDSSQNITNSANVSLEITTPQQLDISGSIQFASQTSTERLQDLQPEYLSKYKITIYDKEDFNKEDSEPVYQSDWIITNDEIGNNRFDYSCYYDFQIDHYYYLYFEYVTNNDYTEKKEYFFKCIESTIEALKGTLNITPNEEFGSLDIEFKPDNDENYYGNITIRRASSKSEYLEWVDIFTTHIDLRQGKERKPVTFSDTSIESNIYYRYCIQKRTADGKRGQIIPFIDDEDSPYKNTFGTIPELVVFEHIFLTRGDRQLRVMLNPNISGFSYRVNEALTETIGNQYPYAIRNANTYYRTFSLSGTISALMDEYPDFSREEQDASFLHKYDDTGMEPMEGAYYNHQHENNFIISTDGAKLSRYKTDYSRAAAEDNPQTAIDKVKNTTWVEDWDYHWYDEGIKNNFLDKKTFLKISNKHNPIEDKDAIYESYENYNKENLVTKYNDFIWETFFRNEVMKWLYENDVKLYRSATEGNIIVKLTDISFTPNQQLSRMIWDFSCTCTEVLPVTYNNLVKYGLCDIGKISDTTEDVNTTLKGKVYTIVGLDEATDPRNKNNDIVLQLNNDLNATMEDMYHKRTLYKIYSLTIDMPAKGNTRYPTDINEVSYRAIPYSIRIDENGISRVDGVQERNGKKVMAGKNIEYGFIIHINNEPVYISPLGIYHIEDMKNGLEGLTSISILKENIPDFEYYNPSATPGQQGTVEIISHNDTRIKDTMNFVINTQYEYTISEDTSIIASRSFDYDVYAQLNNSFISPKTSIYSGQTIRQGDNIIDIIKKKYNVNKGGKYVQTFEYLQEVDIEAPVGANVIINDDLDLVVGKSGHIVITGQNNDRIDIKSIVFNGYKLYPIGDLYDEDYTQAGFYKESPYTLNMGLSIQDQIIDPEPNVVYYNSQGFIQGSSYELNSKPGLNLGNVSPTIVQDTHDRKGIKLEMSITNRVIYFNGELLPFDINTGIVPTEVPALVTFRARFRGKEFNK